MQFLTCVKKHPKLYTNWSLMACHFLELQKGESIKEPLEDSLFNLVQEVRHIDVVQSPIELVIPCFIHYLEDL